MEQIVQISVIFISNKSIIIEIKDSNHVSLTSNISAKTWSNWTCRGCFGNVRTSRFQICPWFWKSTKICGSNRAKQNITDFFPLLYYCTKVEVLAERQWDAVQCCNSMKGNDVISFKKTESCAYRLSSFYPLKNFTLRNISLKKIFKWIGIHFIFNWSV